MTLASRLKAEGKAEGTARGIRVGTIQTVQRVLGEPVSGEAELAVLSLDELDARVRVLQSRLAR